MTNDCTFNGWANRATWNIALWMRNEETLTVLARRIANGGGNYNDLAAGMEYQVNPGRTGNRWQQKVNGVMQDFYELVRPLQPDAPQTHEGSGAIQTNAEKAAAKEPPVVKGGRFAGFLFGEED